ncbi:MAG: hypothetical protein ABI682_09410 [Acidobacteriota bacterium]
MVLKSPGRTLAIAAVVVAAALARNAGAQPVSPLSERTYEELRAMAQELDARARQANDPARHRQESAYRDRGFTRQVSTFSRRATGFNRRLAEYRLRPFNLDTDLRTLAQDAETVQTTLERSRRASDRSLADWGVTSDLIGRMASVLRTDERRSTGDRRGDGRRGYGRDDRSGRGGRERERGAPGAGDDPGSSTRYESGRYGRSGGFPDLARDLADRSARLAESARQLSGPIPADARQRSTWQAMAQFAEQARALSQKAEQGADPRQLKTSLDAVDQARRETDAQLKQSNVFPELRRDWAAATQTLEKLRSASRS